MMEVKNLFEHKKLQKSLTKEQHLLIQEEVTLEKQIEKF